MALFKMTRATGHALNIPPHAIRTLQSVRKGSKPDAPRAMSHIRYDLGAGPQQALLVDDFDTLRDRLAEAVPSVANWVEATVWEAGRRGESEDSRDRVLFDRQHVVAIEGLDPDEPKNDGGQALIYLNLFGQGQAIALASWDDANDLTDKVEAQVEAPAPDHIVQDFRQPPRAARVAAPAKPGGKPKPASKPRAVPVPAKGPAKPTGAKKAAVPIRKR